MKNSIIDSNNILYLETGIATEEQIIKSISSTIASAQQKYNIGPCKYRINIMKKMDSSKKYHSLGYAYIWFSNKKLYNMLLDGKHDMSNFMNKPLGNMFPEKNQLWLRLRLVPLISIAGYQYNNHQMISLIKDAKQCGNNDTIPSIGYFNISPALIKLSPRNDTINHALYSSLDKLITKKDLISFYGSLATTELNEYPQIYIFNYYNKPLELSENISRTRFGVTNDSTESYQRIGLIIFSPKSTNAQSARLLPFKISKLNEKNQLKRITVIFNHPKKILYSHFIQYIK